MACSVASSSFLFTLSLLPQSFVVVVLSRRLRETSLCRCCFLGKSVQLCSRMPTTLRDMSTQELTCYETKTCTFEPQKSSYIHSFTRKHSPHSLVSIYLVHLRTPPPRHQGRFKTSRSFNSYPRYMSEFPIASPGALAIAAGDNYGVRHLDTHLLSTFGALRGAGCCALTCSAEAFAVEARSPSPTDDGGGGTSCFSIECSHYSS